MCFFSLLGIHKIMEECYDWKDLFKWIPDLLENHLVPDNQGMALNHGMGITGALNHGMGITEGHTQTCESEPAF